MADEFSQLPGSLTMPLPRPKHFLDQFPNQVFIETGSNHGDGIQAALDAGFECIHSVELSPYAFGWCSHRFEKEGIRVHLSQGDSRPFLRDLLSTTTTKVTFWLDAHECGSGVGDAKDCPLLEELQIITMHPIKEHTILIDDVRLFGSDSFPTSEMVINLLSQINPNYHISFADSADFDRDILIATPSRL